MEEFSNYRSKDFYLSSVCLACGCTITHLERKPGDFMEFVFKESPEDCIEIIESYWADELQVNPKDLINAINELKTRIKSGV